MAQRKRSLEIKVDVRLSIIKPLPAKWIVKFYYYIKSKQEIVCNKLKKSRITKKSKKTLL